MPNCLILNGHPLSPSFSGAVANRYAETLEQRGIKVRRLDISEMTVPEMTTRKPANAELTGDVSKFWEAMVWADHVMVVHPLWWGSMPAKLKALFDIGLQSGSAYRYVANKPLPLGLMAGRSARLVVTSDTPNWFMASFYANAHFRTVSNQILKFVGFKPVHISHLSVLRGATSAHLEKLLTRISADAARDADTLKTAHPKKLAA